jgi:predicted short-subunit dehydrogenase-like oxidoreductase (DUF2520 family)
MRIGIIGAGKVGIAIAASLQRKGFEIGAVSDAGGDKPLSAAMAFLGPGPLYTDDNAEVTRTCDVVAIATQDRAIGGVAAELDGKMERFEGTVIFHTSGADPSGILSPLDRKGALLGSLHPLQTFPDIESAIAALPSTFIFIEGMEGALPVLERLGRAIGYRVLRIDADHKALYHLSAVFVCNLMCALFFSAEGIMKRIGIEFAPFLPIIRATLKNIEEKGALRSLTGPITRGDVKTVEAHLNALKDMGLEREVYRVLSRVAHGMSSRRGGLTDETMKRFNDLLEGVDDREGCSKTEGE